MGSGRCAVSRGRGGEEGRKGGCVHNVRCAVWNQGACREAGVYNREWMVGVQGDQGVSM